MTDHEGETARPQAMFFKAGSLANQWDTWVYHHEGVYYLFTLAGQMLAWDGIGMAVSTDGVWWSDRGYILRKSPDMDWMGTGSTWRAPAPNPYGRFILNFSEKRGDCQTIHFAASDDLEHWTRLGPEHAFRPDPRWYEPHVWDCIWSLPAGDTGLWGYWNGRPKPGVGGQFGFGRSRDGIAWEALPPPPFDGIPEGEVGAIERIGDRFYMLYGKDWMMHTLVAERPEGPFRRAARNPVALSGNTYFARFVRTPDGLLVNHHSHGINGWPYEQEYFAPMKRAVVDSEGVFRLMWWRGNESLKQYPVDLREPAGAVNTKGGVVLLDGVADAARGLVLEGTLDVPSPEQPDPVGLYLEHGPGAGGTIHVVPGGVTELGTRQCDGSDLRVESRIDRDAGFAGALHFRLLLKGPLYEFYLDDHMIQCGCLPAAATGRIGLIRRRNTDIRGLRAWLAEPA